MESDQIWACEIMGFVRSQMDVKIEFVLMEGFDLQSSNVGEMFEYLFAKLEASNCQYFPPI